MDAPQRSTNFMQTNTKYTTSAENEITGDYNWS